MDRDDLISALADAMAGWSPDLRRRLASDSPATRTDARYIAAAIVADKLCVEGRTPEPGQPSLFPAQGHA